MGLGLTLDTAVQRIHPMPVAAEHVELYALPLEQLELGTMGGV